MEELENLIAEYLEQYPEAETPMNMFTALGQDGIIEILKNRKGREIAFEYSDEELDKMDWRYL